MASLGPSFPVSFGIVCDVFITRIVVCNKVKVVFALAPSNFGFLLLPIYFLLFAESSRTCLTILLAKCFLVLLWPVSSSVCLDTHIYPSGGFLFSSAKRVTPVHGSDSDSDLSPIFHLSSMVAS